MKKHNNWWPILLFILISTSCNDDDDNPNPCEQTVVVNNDLFMSTETDNYDILNASIKNDCLEIELSSGGCDGSTWTIGLIDADRIAETAIVQRDLKVSLQNTEPCDAIINRTISFNIKLLRTEDDEITLNLERWDTQLEYRY